VLIRLYRCPVKKCGAVFTVLPAFVARHLWREWKTVQDVSKDRRKAPRRTRDRWIGRLASSAKQLIQLFNAKAIQILTDRAGLDWLRALCGEATRGEFIDKLLSSGALSACHVFALVAAWIHRIEPGVRLM
jgi:hypothetical protein